MRPIAAKPLLAYVVHDGDDGWAIVFATTGIAGRRMGANEIGCDFEEVTSCRREKGFDAYAPGPVPPLVTLSHNWHWECSGCLRTIKEGMEDYEDEAGPHNITAAMAIDVGGELYCCQACHVATMAGRAARRACGDAAIERLTGIVRHRVPRAEITYTHAYTEQLMKGSDTYTCTECKVDFTFPGGTHTADLRFTRDRPETLFWVKEIDLEAWDDHQASIQAWRRQLRVAV